MIRFLLTLALTGVLLSCGPPAPSPVEPRPLVSAEVAEMDSLQTVMRQDLAVVRYKADSSWRKLDGYYICNEASGLCRSYLLIYNEETGLDMRLYLQWLGCPDPGSNQTCSGGGSLNDPTPVGTCTDQTYWLDLVDTFLNEPWPAGSYKAGPSYTGWFVYEVTLFGPSGLLLKWDYQDPGGPSFDCPIPPYVEPAPEKRPRRTKYKFEALSETGRGEQ